MNTTHTRRKAIGAAPGAVDAGAAATARRPLKMLIVAALALGAVLLAPSATVAHAAPDDGGDVPTKPQPLQVHVSENPVVFAPGDDPERWITVTWTPPKGYTKVVTDNVGGGELWTWSDTGSAKVWIWSGQTYDIWVENLDTGEVSPRLRVNTQQLPDIPDPPDITLIPKPGLPGPGPELPVVVRLP